VGTVGETVGGICVAVEEGTRVGVADGLNTILSARLGVGSGMKLQAERAVRTKINKSFRIMQWLLFGFL